MNIENPRKTNECPLKGTISMGNICLNFHFHIHFKLTMKNEKQSIAWFKNKATVTLLLDGYANQAQPMKFYYDVVGKAR